MTWDTKIKLYYKIFWIDGLPDIYRDYGCNTWQKLYNTKEGLFFRYNFLFIMMVVVAYWVRSWFNLKTLWAKGRRFKSSFGRLAWMGISLKWKEKFDDLCPASRHLCSDLGNWASWSFRSRITGSALKLNLQCQNWNFFGKKTWSIFEANLLHLNFVLSNIPGCPFWLWLFHAKLSYYLLQQLLKFKIYYASVGF